jgi:hypothetical protein
MKMRMNRVTSMQDESSELRHRFIQDDMSGGECKGNLTVLKRILHLDLAKTNPKRIL